MNTHDHFDAMQAVVNDAMREGLKPLRGVDRLRSIEANAWRRYRLARERAAREPSADTGLDVIAAGEAWERANDRLHERERRDLADVARRGRL